LSNTVQFRRGDAKWEEYRERCKTDLYWFCDVILGYGEKVLMTERVHRALCRFATHTTGIPEIDQAPYRKIEMPRGTGKSTLITQGYIIQRILQNPDISILICNERLENATAFLSAIKQEFENNDVIRELFPEIIPDIKARETVWATERIVVKRTVSRKEPTVFCIGTGGTVTGMHPDLIVGDDILSREAAENARTGYADMTGKINRWITQLVPLLSAGAEPFPEILFIGTRWYPGDSYEFIEQAFGYGQLPRTWNITERLPDGTTQVIPVTLIGDVACFRRAAIEDGRAIWPEKPGYDLEGLAKLRMTDPVLFAANYMNNPTDQVTATFKDDWLRYYDWLDPETVTFIDQSGKKAVYSTKDLDTVMLVDPGGFGARGANDNRVRAAVLVTGTTPNFDHLILDVFSDVATFNHVAEHVLTTAVRFQVRRVFVEAAGQQAAFVELLRRLAKERNAVISFDTVAPKSVQKEQRILLLEPYFQRGQMLIGKDKSWTEFREQYRTFPRGRRSDVLDALAYGPGVWRKPVPSMSQRPDERQRKELELYKQRRGLALR